MLIKHGENDIDGPLNQASYRGHLKICELLIDHGADIYTKNNDGWTPLHNATYAEHLDVCRLLIEHGANVHLKNNWTNTITIIIKLDYL